MRQSVSIKRLVILLSPLLLLGLWAFWLEPASIRLREVPLALPGWRIPLRIAILADLHVGSPYQDIPKLRKIIALTHAAHPDIILIPGDLVTGYNAATMKVRPETFVPLLGSLHARLGVFAVLGNHDWWTDAAAVRTALQENGIAVIDNQAVKLTANGRDFWLAGVGDVNEGYPDIDAALKGVPSHAPLLLMTHNPDLFPQVPPRVSLTIAAHTHGGQVYIPFIGRPIVPSRYGERYAIGHIIEEGRHLYVSPGIGSSILPVRFLVPPEVTLLILQTSP